MGLMKGMRRDHDYIGVFNFKVEIEGVTVGAFSEVSGLDVEVEVIEYQDGLDKIRRKRPGQTKYTNLVLKRGKIEDRSLREWFELVRKGVPERKTVSVVVLSDDMEEIMRWNLYEAFPCKWKGFKLEGKGNDVMTEEIEITYEYYETISAETTSARPEVVKV